MICAHNFANYRTFTSVEEIWRVSSFKFVFKQLLNLGHPLIYIFHKGNTLHFGLKMQENRILQCKIDFLDFFDQIGHSRVKFKF